MPGTFASIAASAIIWLLKGHPNTYILVTIIIIVAGFIVSAKAEKLFGKKDAECIVIDEIAGMFLSVLFLPINTVTLFCAFVLFRGFDAAKIYPADILQKLDGAGGVMADDIIAGIYTNLILQFVLRWPSCRIS